MSLRQFLALVTLIAAAAGRDLWCQAAPNPSALVDQFLALERARQAPGATEADIDRLLALVSDSVVYEHPRAGARLQGKTVLRRGMLNYLGTIRTATDSVVSRMAATGVVVISVESRGEQLRNGRWEPLARRTLRVFEFDSRGAVSRIIEYGW